MAHQAGCYRDRVVWAIVLISVVLKLALVVELRSAPPKKDENVYLALARTLAVEHRYAETFRPPLYPSYLAVMLAIGWDKMGVWVGQVLLGTVSVVLVYRIARRTLNRRAARIAAALFAFDPLLAWFTHRIWSETLFIVFLLGAVDFLTSAPAVRRIWPWLSAGLLLGLAGLTRPMILTWVPLLLPWAILQMHRARPCLAGPAKRGRRPKPTQRAGKARRGRPRPDHYQRKSGAWLSGGWRFALLCLTCGLVVLPWTLRNFRQTGAFILVDTNGPFNLLVGNQPETAFVDKDDHWSRRRFGLVDGIPYRTLAKRNPRRAQHLATQAAWAHIKASPGRFVKKTIWEAGHLYTLDSFMLRHLRNGWYERTVPPWAIQAITLVSAGFTALLVLAGFAALAAQPASPFRGLAILLLLHSTLLFGVVYSLSRYGVPLRWVLAVAAGAALAHPGKLLSTLRHTGLRSRRILVLLLMSAVIGWAWARDLPLLKDMLTTGGSAYVFERDM